MTTLTLNAIGGLRAHSALISDISLSTRAGEMLALLGPNGAGKTTLLKMIAQLLPYRGQISWAGQDLKTLRPLQRARQIAYLSQNHDWSWPISVAELVALGRYPHERRGATPVDDPAVRDALRQTGLETFAARPLNQLSGGERARAMLARALAVEADVLLADEPVAALDPYHQLRMMGLLRNYCRAGHTAIVVLHDLTLASRFCDRIALLDHGKLVALGKPAEVLSADHIRQVYGVDALRGEHEQQGYVLPWRANDEHVDHDVEDRNDDHAVCL